MALRETQPSCAVAGWAFAGYLAASERQARTAERRNLIERNVHETVRIRALDPARGASRRGRAGGRPAAAILDGPGMAVHPRRSGGGRAAGLRRPRLAPPRSAARLEHRGDA